MSSSCCAKNPLPAVNMNKRSSWLGCSWARFWDYLVLVLTTTQVTKHIELHTSFSGLTPTMYEYQNWATYCRSYDESENSTSRTRRPEKVDWNAHESWTCSYLPYIPWFSALCTKVWSRNTRTVWTWREEKGMANPSGWSWPIEFPICMLSIAVGSPLKRVCQQVDVNDQILIYNIYIMIANS